MTVQESSTLVFLHVSQWGARRYDAKASKEVADAHGATDAGRFNKLLVDKAHLAAINKAVSALRTAHYEYTLPWRDDGARLLPNGLFLKYAEVMQSRTLAFKGAVADFERLYPKIVEDARKRLGSLYKPEDYPVNVASRFEVRMEHDAIPNAKDFRLDAAAESADLIRDQVTSSMNETLQKRMEEAGEHVRARARAALERVVANCNSPKPIIHDSMMGEISTLIDVLPAMNLTRNPRIDEICRRLQYEVLTPTARLRTSKAARGACAANALSILGSL